MTHAKPLRLQTDVLLKMKMKMKIGMTVVAMTLALLCGCARQATSDNPKVGDLSIGTNALLSAIQVGMDQDEVVTRIGMPAGIMNEGLCLLTTNSTGTAVDVPMTVWTYRCTNGSMWIVFGTNKVVHTVGPNPGMSL